MWMKPSEINAIIDERYEDEVKYLSIQEAGSELDPRVLTWAIEHAVSSQINLRWTINGGAHWIGSPEFNTLMKKDNPLNM